VGGAGGGGMGGMGGFLFFFFFFLGGGVMPLYCHLSSSIFASLK